MSGDMLNPNYGKRAKLEPLEIEGDLLEAFRTLARRHKSSTDRTRGLEVVYQRLEDLTGNAAASYAVQLQAIKVYLAYACGQPEMRVLSTPGSTTNVAMMDVQIQGSDLGDAQRELSEWRTKQLEGVANTSSAPPMPPTSSTPTG